MPSFVCAICETTLRKPQVKTHLFKFRHTSYTCIDCNKSFNENTVHDHTSCVTEPEKYHGKFAKKKSEAAVIPIPSIRSSDTKPSSSDNNTPTTISHTHKRKRENIDGSTSAPTTPRQKTPKSDTTTPKSETPASSQLDVDHSSPSTKASKTKSKKKTDTETPNTNASGSNPPTPSTKAPKTKSKKADTETPNANAPGSNPPTPTPSTKASKTKSKKTDTETKKTNASGSNPPTPTPSSKASTPRSKSKKTDPETPKTNLAEPAVKPFSPVVTDSVNNRYIDLAEFDWKTYTKAVLNDAEGSLSVSILKERVVEKIVEDFRIRAEVFFEHKLQNDSKYQGPKNKVKKS
jgi:cell growth-regulating nucleolar protein